VIDNFKLVTTQQSLERPPLSGPRDYLLRRRQFAGNGPHPRESSSKAAAR
jgi:hypothetical protein